MRIAIVTVSKAGASTAEKLMTLLDGEVESVARESVDEAFSRFDAFIFVSAMGICVRTIAPLLRDKHTDPAVVCVDCAGRQAIAVVAGHVGGANDLTGQVAAALGAMPVITTQSDTLGLWALDTMGKKYGWETLKPITNAMIFAFVNRQPTALLLDIRDAGTEALERSLPSHVTLIHHLSEATPQRFRLVIAVSPYALKAPAGTLFLQYVPHVFDIGLGLAHQAGPTDEIIRLIKDTLTQHGLLFAPRHICTIDLKANEPVVNELRKQYVVQLFSADKLKEVEVPTPSTVVENYVGTASVCEAAALLAANNGPLLLTKQKGKNYTVAVAIDRCYLREGHIEIVGAGPGDPDLVSVRGRKMLEKADLILYAGSLVPRELTLCAKAGATVRSSASMALEEQCALMKSFYDAGKFVVRLHTGDPCIFGAIQEQMAFFDKHGMHYHITPGISSFLAAAAELRSQFTIPEKCQTIILTRGEGRTPMPEKEKLHLLARSQSTMCIFLSATIANDVQHELLMEYPADTPVAVCYHLTWKDQRIYRGRLSELAQLVNDNHLTLTTLLVVGEAIDNRSQKSKLYDGHFTHLFRKGEE